MSERQKTALANEERILRRRVEAFLRDPHRGTLADVVLCLMTYRDFYYRKEDE